MKKHFFSNNPLGVDVVTIGGGNGLSTLLLGLKKYVLAKSSEKVSENIAIDKLSAIVAVSDDGGSSGRLRDELQILPPGDIRNCMVALSEDSHLLSKLFQHRFSGKGELGGHSFGNLFLAALTEITKDFSEAVRLSSEILAIKGTIYPATMEDVRLVAELKDGSTVYGETNISKVGTLIKKLSLEPQQCHPLPEAIQAIKQADVITLGPGSLFTSLLPPILVKGVAEAINESKAIKFFICNLMTQPGETDNLSAETHLEIIKSYAPQIDFDYILVNNRQISRIQSERYKEEGAKQIGLGETLSENFVGKAEIIHADLLAESEKVRHDSDKLARVILQSALKHSAEKSNSKTGENTNSQIAGK